MLLQISNPPGPSGRRMPPVRNPERLGLYHARNRMHTFDFPLDVGYRHHRKGCREATCRTGSDWASTCGARPVDWPAFLRGRAARRRARLRPFLDLGPPAGDLRRPGPADLRGLHGARRRRASDDAGPARPVRRRQHVPHPGLAVKAITTIDHISGGRAIMGIGGAWFEGEHRAFGLDFGSGFGQRLDWLAEAVPAMRALLDGEEVTSAPGGHYAFDRLRINSAARPAPPADHDRRHRRAEDAAHRRAARRHLERRSGRPRSVAHKDAVLRAHCADVGRDPAAIERTVGCKITIRSTEAEAERVRRALLAHNRTPLAGRWRRVLLDRDARADRRDDGRATGGSASTPSSSSSGARTTRRRWRRCARGEADGRERAAPGLGPPGRAAEVAPRRP